MVCSLVLRKKVFLLEIRIPTVSQNKKDTLLGVFFIWRRRRDSKGPAFHSLRENRLCSASPSGVRVSLFYKKINPTQPSGCIGFIWRRRRDSQGSALHSLRENRLCSASPREFESLPKLFYTKLKRTSRRISFLIGAEGETRTLAPVSRPTPLAGAPRHQLEYFCIGN